MRTGKKGRHTSVDKSARPLFRWLEAQPEVERLVLGVTENCRHSYPPGHLKLQGSVPGGLRFSAYLDGGVMRLFIRIQPESQERLLTRIQRRLS